MATVGDPAVHNVDDVVLVERILAEPSAGWAIAWERYGHPLHSFCLRMLDDPAEADDAVADVFLVAAQRIGQLRQPEAFRAWLYAIARRRIQRRWKDRDRTAPIDPRSEVVMNIATSDMESTGAGDAAELIAAASAGLNDRDRTLLALTLSAELDTTEVARITGQTVNAVSVRVTRLKETVGRAAGALLVARHHRRDCGVLDGILSGWDGGFDTVWRKRIARHVESCDDCEEKRGAATAVFAAPLLLAPPATSLRDRVLESVDTEGSPVTEDLGPWDGDGFPAVTGRRRWLPIAMAVGVAVLVITLAAAIMIPDGDDDSALIAVDDGTTTGSTEAPDDEPAETPTTAAPGPGTTPIGPATTDAGEVATPTAPPDAPPVSNPPVLVQPAPAPTPTLAEGPHVTIALSPTVVVASAAQTVEVTLHVDAPAGGATTVVSWNGPNAGSTSVAGTGSLVEMIGPFNDAGSSGTGTTTVTVTATTTDAHGRTHSSSAPLTVNAIPG